MSNYQFIRALTRSRCLCVCTRVLAHGVGCCMLLYIRDDTRRDDVTRDPRGRADNCRAESISEYVSMYVVRSCKFHARNMAHAAPVTSIYVGAWI